MKVRGTLLILIVGSLMLFANNLLADSADWLKKAQLGPHAPVTQDWAAIEKAAKKEGKVVIYSVSSRISKLVKEFKELYGIEIVGYDLASGEQIQKFGREYKADIHQVDVLYNQAASEMIARLLKKKMIWNFIPEGMEAYLDDHEKEPLLIQRWSSRVLIYNTKFNPEKAPIDSLWDLTRQEWAGKILTPEPTEDVMSSVFQTILSHPNEMAAAYEKEFGEKITLSDEINNAAEEWMLRFTQNKPLNETSTTKIFKGIASVKQKNTPPIGFTTFSKLRKLKDGVTEASPIYNLDPVFGVAYPTVIAITDQAPHPNAAKLLIRHMMEKGYWPWDVLGDYAAHKDVEATQVEKFKVPAFDDAKLWIIDPMNVYNTSGQYVDFIMNVTP
jgi:iron(III) transport system substrate-binding protein